MRQLLNVIGAEIWQIYDNVRFKIMRARLVRERKARDRRRAEINRDRVVSAPVPTGSRYCFDLHWHCRDCDRYGEIFLDKIAAALPSEIKQMDLRCAFCGSASLDRSHHGWLSDLDAEVLAYWSEHEDAYVLEQDEDLIIAGLDIGTILAALTRVQEGRSAKWLVLVEAILVKYRDGSYTPDEKDAIERWLVAHAETWRQPHVWEYLRNDVEEKLQANGFSV